MTQQLAGPVYFKLKDAKEYGFWGRAGQRRLLVKRGEVITMTTKKDIDYFRARGDVMVECTPEGVPVDEEGRVGHLVPGKPKSFRVYGRRAGPQPVAPARPQPQVMQVAARTAPTPVVATPVVATPVVAKPQVQPAVTQTPGELLADAPTPQGEDVSPIEFAARDGSTESVQSGVDPRV